MVKSVNCFKLTGKVVHKCIIKVRQFSAAKTSCMKDYIKPDIIEKSPEHDVLDIETNDLDSSRMPAGTAEEIVDLAKSVKMNNSNISMSGLVPSADNFNNKDGETIDRLQKMCGNSSLQFINHYPSIKPNEHTNRSDLHVNRTGNSIFQLNFEKFLFNYYW